MSQFNRLKKLAPVAMEKLAVPQRIAMQKLAETIGAPAKTEGDSESSAQAIVEKVASEAGIPEDSVAGNVAKAVSVAGLEVFADPIGMFPVGKIQKVMKSGQKMLKATSRAEKVLENAPKAITRGGAFLPGQLADEATQLSKDAKIVQKVVSGPASQVGQRFRAEKIASDAFQAEKKAVKAIKQEIK